MKNVINNQVADAILDLRDVQNEDELNAYVEMIDSSIIQDDDVQNVINEMRTQFVPETAEQKIARLEARIAELESKKSSPATVKPVVQRAENVYKIVRLQSDMCKKPQQVALLKILATFGIGAEVPESQIIAEVEKHAATLRTRQEPKRIWQYYKGDHTDGFTAHGLISKV